MHLLFLDLETTGLDPDRDQILEVGAILTKGPEMETVWDVSGIIAHRWAYLGVRPKVDPVVAAMHEASGLWEACAYDTDAMPLEDTESMLVEMLIAEGIKPGSVMLAGFSCHFDREFLRRHMPILFSYLSHRIVDVSTVRTLFWSTREGKPEQAKAHRALADCEEARAELLRYMPNLAAWNMEIDRPGESPEPTL